MSILWELRQNRKIRQAEASGAHGAAMANMVGQSLDQLAKRVDRLALTCRALWSLLSEQTELTEEDLIKRVEQIAAEDAAEEDQTTGAPCPKCSRPLPRNGRCLYCGGAMETDSAFDQVL